MDVTAKVGSRLAAEVADGNRSRLMRPSLVERYALHAILAVKVNAGMDRPVPSIGARLGASAITARIFIPTVALSQRSIWH